MQNPSEPPGNSNSSLPATDMPGSCPPARDADATASCECRQLREKVQLLEARMKEVQGILNAVQCKRNEYRRIVYDWAHAQITDEEIEASLANLDDCSPLEVFIGELEAIACGNENKP